MRCCLIPSVSDFLDVLIWMNNHLHIAFYYYMLYRNAPHPKRSDPIAGLLRAILVSGLVFYWLGTNLGIGVACSSASASNLCGLFGYFVLGPIASAVGIIFAAKIWSMYAIKAL